MHRHEDLLKDLNYEGLIPNEMMFSWFNDRFSTSKHLLTLYSITRGLNAKKVLEVGFGRSSFVLARAVHENGGKLITCDHRDFSYLLSKREKEVIDYKRCLSDKLWPEVENESLDFAFLDYFSGEKVSKSFVEKEIELCLLKMKGNGVIAVHDVFDDRFKVGDVLTKYSKKLIKPITYSYLPYNYGLGIIHVNVRGKKIVKQDQFLKQD